MWKAKPAAEVGSNGPKSTRRAPGFGCPPSFVLATWESLPQLGRSMRGGVRGVEAMPGRVRVRLTGVPCGALRLGKGWFSGGTVMLHCGTVMLHPVKKRVTSAGVHRIVGSGR